MRMMTLKKILYLKIKFIKKVVKICNEIIFPYIEIMILGRKQYIGCLVKSEYADGSDDIQFYLFENKTARNSLIPLHLFEYEK